MLVLLIGISMEIVNEDLNEVEKFTGQSLMSMICMILFRPTYVIFL